MLVEPSAYAVMLDNRGRNTAKLDTGKKEKSKSSAATNKAKKDYAQARGVKRGMEGGDQDAILVKDCSVIDEDAMDEGLLTLVQAGTCRRMVLKAIYSNHTTRKPQTT
jgi:hypothetical protein